MIVSGARLRTDLETGRPGVGKRLKPRNERPGQDLGPQPTGTRRRTLGTVVQRGSRLGDPNEYVAGADWPGGDLLPDAPVAAQYAQGISRNLVAALAGTTVSELARKSGVHRATIHELLAGRTWGDVVTIAKLEDAAGVPLWPGRPERYADAPEARSRHK